MPLPLLFIGAAAVGAVGAGKAVKAGIDSNSANRINQNANEIVESATELLNKQRIACGKSLEKLGEEKIFILNNSISDFVHTFSKIKNIDFVESEGLTELGKLHIDQKEFEDLEEMSNFAGSIAAGTIAGTAGGALTALGAYSAAGAFASASTGTAIASLSGAAASNATLAFLGGGSLAAGGAGVAGGMLVLGGLVAGPALLVMGFIVGAKAGKNLDNAYANKAEAMEIAEQLDVASFQCESVRRRTYVIYNLLARLDSYFLPLVYALEDIVEEEGTDYQLYALESKKAVAAAASVAGTIKAVLDTALLTEDGNLTDESKTIVEGVSETIVSMEEPEKH